MQYRLCFSFALLLVFVATFSPARTANILDLLWNGEEEVEKREESADDSSQKSCICNGPACMCCVDFNLTYIDLGGPGCVQMKYISQSEGISVNVSYGDSLLHSADVKGQNPEPTCISLLVNFAQVCARFSDLQPKDDGLRGCLLLEPKLLGDVTTSFNIGCFTMGPQGMKLEETNTTFTTLTENENGNALSNSTQSESEGLNEEELIAAVNESAEQGLVFFGNLLGITFGKPEANDTNAETTTQISTSTTIEPVSTNAPQSHSRKLGRLFKTHNQL